MVMSFAHLLFVLALICANLARAQEAPPAAQPKAAAPRRQVIEVTFGAAQLFNRQSIVEENGRLEEQVIPVSSALLMFEWLFHARFSALALFNLPLDTQKTVVDGESRDEFVAPSLSLGVRASALSIEVFAASRLELQLAALAGVSIGSSSGDVVFPLAAGRLHFANQAGFALYLGGAFAFRRDTVALLYGIGHRF
jgi:hypothetical protein